MATRRMFHTDVVECDRFLDLPFGSQLIYFHLGMQADDDGFVNCPKQICRMIKRPAKELQALIDNGFLFDFDDVMVIKHFRVANSLKNDRKKPLTYPEIAKHLKLTPNRCYSTDIDEGDETLYDLRSANLAEKNGIRLDSQPNRTEENRTEENRTEENRTEENQTEESRAEGSRREGPEARSGQLRFMGGTLGKGVLLISDDQIENLLDRMGLDAFNYYTEKLAKLLLEDKVKSKNHYATIMRWYLEDSEVES